MYRYLPIFITNLTLIKTNVPSSINLYVCELTLIKDFNRIFLCRNKQGNEYCVKLVENLLNLEKIGFGERSEPNPIFSKFSRFETNFELTPRPRTVVGSHLSSLELL